MFIVIKMVLKVFVLSAGDGNLNVEEFKAALLFFARKIFGFYN